MTFTMHLWRAKTSPIRVMRRRFSSLPASPWRSRSAQPRALQSKALTTVFYSTVMATACAADVHMKQSRRQKLDEDIATLEEELGRGSKLPGKRSSTPSDEQTPPIQQLFLPSLRNPNVLEPTVGYFSQSIFAAPSSIYSDRAYKLLGSRPKSYGWTPRKCLKVELAVAHMSTRMMLHLNDSTQLNVAPLAPHVSENLAHFKTVLADLEERLQDIKSVKDSAELKDADSLKFPHYEAPEPGARLWAAKLNRAIRQTLHQHSMKQINDQQAVTRVAYDLMVSKRAPDNSTFTNLISYFSAIKKHELVEIIVQGLQLSSIRKDEMSLNAILRHYTVTNNYNAFSICADKIKGRLGGLMQAQPNVIISQGNETLQASSKGPARRVVEDQPLLSTLISGYLRFGSHRKALAVYREMLDNGFQPQPSTLNSFLWFYGNSRLRRRKERMTDAQAMDFGLKIWHHVLALREQGIMGNSSMANAFEYMLSLCHSCGSEAQLVQIQQQQALDTAVGKRDQKVSRPWFHNFRREARRKRRKFVEIENVMARLENDIRKATARVLASKLLLAGHPMDYVQNVFEAASAVPKSSHWMDAHDGSSAQLQSDLSEDKKHDPIVKKQDLIHHDDRSSSAVHKATPLAKESLPASNRSPVWQRHGEPTNPDSRPVQTSMNLGEHFPSHLSRSAWSNDVQSSFAV